jgi:hypothetical protein
MILALKITGQLVETATGPGGTDEHVVYQRCGAGFGNLIGDGSYNLQRRRYVIPANTITPAVSARRQHLAAGVAAWQAMTTEQRADWKRDGARLNLPPYNAFLRAWLRASIADHWDDSQTGWDYTTPTPWDGGAAQWDGGAALWDHYPTTIWNN